MDAGDPIAITLTASEWNVIIQALHEVPYRVAAPLITAIATQARRVEEARVMPPPVAEPEAAPLNGATIGGEA